jgi:hypothetical protein
MEPNATHALIGPRCQAAGSRIRPRDGAGAGRSENLIGIQHASVVGAVGVRLHQGRALEADRTLNSLVSRRWGIPHRA